MPKTNKKPDARTLRYALAQQEVNEASGQYFPKTTAELDAELGYGQPGRHPFQECCGGCRADIVRFMRAAIERASKA